MLGCIFRNILQFILDKQHGLKKTSQLKKENQKVNHIYSKNRILHLNSSHENVNIYVMNRCNILFAMVKVSLESSVMDGLQ